MSSYKPLDSKREEFRKYLEKSGALSAVTKALVMLYDEPDKPADALDYFRKQLGDGKTDEAELDILKTDLEAAMLKIQMLENEISTLKERLLKYEPEEKEATEKDAVASDTSINTATAVASVPSSVEPVAESAGITVDTVPT